MTKSISKGSKPKGSAPKGSAPKGSTPKSRLSHHRRPPVEPVAPIEAFDPLYPGDAAIDGYTAACLKGLRPAREVLPAVALAEALGQAGIRRLQGNDGIVVIVEVPSADWVPHIEIALNALCAWTYICCRWGGSRTGDKPSEGNDKVARLISEGARVAGISQSPSRFLPATSTSASGRSPIGRSAP